MQRRVFCSASLGIAVLGAGFPTVFARAAAAEEIAPAGADRVLVVVQLNGGNDGLNTVIPYTDDAYYKARPIIAVKPEAVLRLDDRIGLNPVLGGLAALYQSGHVAVIDGVGYPNPNLSHFEATEIWETASPDRPQQYGWIGRYLDQRYPAGTKPASLFETVALGDTLPAALVAGRVDVPAIGALGAFNYNTGRDLASKASAGKLYDGAPGTGSPYLGLIAETARAAYHGGDQLRAEIAGYKPGATYPNDGFAQQLKLAAQLIGSRAGVRIVFVSLGSFDTHAGQRAQQDRLLGLLGNGLQAFYADLAAHGSDGRVLTLTFSEFGRRVAQNASNGTDHGTAMPVFAVGGAVRGGLYGAQPSLTDLDHGNLRYNVDFRSVYATVIQRWLGRDPTAILGGSYPPLTFV